VIDVPLGFVLADGQDPAEQAGLVTADRIGARPVQDVRLGLRANLGQFLLLAVVNRTRHEVEHVLSA
jgi:hypothetical protein